MDHCDSCLSGGNCLIGSRETSNDLICLCPHCYSGRLCEFSLQPFTVTLDSLLVFERRHSQIIYIGIAFVLFTIGLLNNLCSLVTFKRPQPRKNAVGTCLFAVTILNQCALLCLLAKFIHIFLGSSTGWTDNISCKTVNYLLSVFTRSTYWLTSWITVDRLLIVIYPTVKIINNASIASWSTIIIFLVILIMHIHEILFSISIQHSDYLASLCVINFGQNYVVTEYNRISTLSHYIIPFIIQIISITLLLVLAARQRMKAINGKITFREILKKNFSTQKELYITPIIIVLSAVPQAILSFSLTCTQPSGWQRHVLLVTYLLSYAPHILGFVLHVMPSSFYKTEFRQTFLAQILTSCLRRCSLNY